MAYSTIQKIQEGDGREKRAWSNALYSSTMDLLSGKNPNSAVQREFEQLSLDGQIDFLYQAVDTLKEVEEFEPHSKKLEQAVFRYRVDRATETSDKPLVFGIDRSELTDVRKAGSFSVEHFPYEGTVEHGNSGETLGLVARYTTPDGKIRVQGNGSSHHWYAVDSLKCAIDRVESAGLGFPRRTA